MSFQRLWLFILVVGLIVIARRKAQHGATPSPQPPSTVQAANRR